MNHNGIILAHKPIGYTSRQVVDHYSKVLKTRKIGHTGTLDPFAEGLLILLVGECTSLQNYFLTFPKTYRATMKLGVATDTLDCEGKVIEKINPLSENNNINFSECNKVIKKYFLGKIRQTPPKYSAIKIQGERAYNLAREGKAFEMIDREIEIIDFVVEKINLEQQTIEMIVTCSSGTYIRTLAYDFGKKLGIQSHLITLHRLSIGEYKNDDFLMDTIEKKNTIHQNEYQNNPSFKSKTPSNNLKENLRKKNHFSLLKEMTPSIKINLKNIEFLFSSKKIKTLDIPVHKHYLSADTLSVFKREKKQLMLQLQNGFFENIKNVFKRGMNIFYDGENLKNNNEDVDGITSLKKEKIILIFAYDLEGRLGFSFENKTEKEKNKSEEKKWKLLYRRF